MLLYNNTLDKILTYEGKNYTLCVQKSIKAMRDMSYHYTVEMTQATPSSGSAITRVQQIIFEHEVKDYVKEKQQLKMKMARCLKSFTDSVPKNSLTKCAHTRSVN